MTDVLTLTLNPCVDRTLWVRDFGEAPQKIEYQSGGKGVNVARVLTNLGASCLAVAPAGGADGAEFARLAKAEGVILQTLPIANATRTVDTYVRLGDLMQKVVVGQPPEMSDAELDALYALVLSHLPHTRVFAVCGSACCAGAAALAGALIGKAREMGAATVLDANKDALIEGFAGKPDLIKPNEKELETLVGRTIAPGEADAAAQTLLEKGAGEVLLSMGARGAALFNPAYTKYCPAPKVQTVNAVGCGDSFLAAYLYARLRGAGDEKALTIACAAGAACARVFPAARVTKDEIEEILGYAI